ncbi:MULTISPECIES: hypothetical protein [Bombella]|uniref:Uncharacterized protein n=1 Tax=Bombella pollinis TaxID=2967337 RepID=A0ABT3WQZ0_9PROT|nr:MULTISPECIES: hypothetical protein [Bombella]MCX5620264.1 hypothetical protein [Bombella pollinis]MUG90521.1 hypothetical protein [Bombella sp. ESL0385]
MNTSPSPLHPPRHDRLAANARTPQRGLPILGRVVLTVIWAIFHFIFSFLIQLAELFAPILLIIGVGWSLIPHLIALASANLGSLTEDPQTHDIVSHISHTLPNQLIIAGHLFTPHSLIMDGLLLMALAAASSTATAWLARRL